MNKHPWKLTVAITLFTLALLTGIAAGAGGSARTISIKATTVQGYVYSLEDVAAAVTDAVYQTANPLADLDSNGQWKKPSYTGGVLTALPSGVVQPDYPRRLQVKVKDQTGNNLNGCVQIRGVSATNEQLSESVCFATTDFSGTPKVATDVTSYAYSHILYISADTTFRALVTNSDYVGFGTVNAFGLPTRINRCISPRSDIAKVQYRATTGAFSDISSKWLTNAGSCDIGSRGKADTGSRSIVYVPLAPDSQRDWRFYINTSDR